MRPTCCCLADLGGGLATQFLPQVGRGIADFRPQGAEPAGDAHGLALVVLGAHRLPGRDVVAGAEHRQRLAARGGLRHARAQRARAGCAVRALRVGADAS